MPFGLAIGLIGAGTGLFSGFEGASAAKTAAKQQADSDRQALDFDKGIYADQKENLAPFRQSGEISLASLMDGITSGRFGMGSLPAPPGFQAPTLEDARNSPGYQFTQEQGNKGILQGAAAAGGAISGGTLRALDKFNSGLADTTYGDVFNRALSTYGAGMQSYQAQLQKQAQEYQQLYNPAALGESAAVGANTAGTAMAGNIGNMMTNIGTAQASGTVGASNALTSGLTGGINSALQSVLVGKLFGNSGKAPAPAYNPFAPGQNGDYPG